MPARRQRTGLGLAVPDDAEDRQVSIVERRAVCMEQRVTELTSLVDRARRLRRVVARDAAGKRKLTEQLAQTGLVQRDVRVALRVRAFEIRIRHSGRTAMPRTHDVDGVEVALLDHAIGMRMDEVQAGSRAPMTQQPGLDVV